MDDAISRFNKRKHILSDNKGIKIVHIADQTMVESFLSSPIDYQSVDRVTSNLSFKLNLNLEVTDQEIHALLKTIEDKYDSEKFDNLFNACKETVLASIAGPFGLGKIVASQDKDGGNVTTAHNAQQGIYADKKDEYQRKNYTNSKNSEGKAFAGDSKKSVGSEFTREQLDKNAYLTDAYTGIRELASDTSPDHIKSCSEAHKDGMFMFGKERKADFATDKDNLASTRREINYSKKDQDLLKFGENVQEGRDVDNKTHYELNHKRVKKQYEKGMAAAEKHMPTTTDKTIYYAKNTAQTGANEGAKMGLQQALGLLLSEFYQATFDEIKDIYKNGFVDGFEGSGFFQILKDRLTRIAKRIASKWENVCEAFTSGFLSGFISNIATVLINSFYTTFKNGVRIIREGFFSLIKAIKILCDPPEGLSFRQAAHEASKIVAAGLIVTGGVLIEEAIKGFVLTIPLLAPFAGFLVPVLVGALTGLATTLVVYLIDKIDLFGAVARERHQFTMDLLEADICQQALKIDPPSASKIDPPQRLVFIPISCFDSPAFIPCFDDFAVMSDPV